MTPELTKPANHRTSELDNLDRRLIAELRRDSRAPVTVLSRRLRVRRVTLQYRLNRLRRSKLIRGFTVLVDRRAEGTDLAAFALVNLASGSIDQKVAGETIARVPGVVEVHDVTGRPDFLIKVRASSIAQAGEILNRVRAIGGIASTETLISVRAYKEEF